MARFFAAPSQWSSDCVSLDPAEARHACEVLRLRVGDGLEVFDGAGRRAVCRLSRISKAGAIAAIDAVSSTPAPACPITLVQSLPKGKLFEWIVEKATELGVSRIVPVISDRSVVRVDSAEALKKCEKWNRVALEASKQCGQDWIPAVTKPVSWREVFSSIGAAANESGPWMVASLRPGARRFGSIRDELRDFRTLRSVTLFVGPEGDFTPAEYADVAEKGAHEVTLGARVLRVETAALCFLGVVAEGLEL